MNRESLQLVADHLSKSLPFSPDQQAWRVTQVFGLLGDMVRAEMYVFPRALRSWLRGLNTDAVEAAVVEAKGWLERCVLPHIGAEPDERLELTVHALDQVKSVVCGLRAIRGPEVWEIPSFEDLDKLVHQAHSAVKQFDAVIVQRCLGDRAFLIDPLGPSDLN